MTPPPHSLSTPVLSWEADGGTQLVSAAPLIDHSQHTSAADFKGLVVETRINLYSAKPLHWDVGAFCYYHTAHSILSVYKVLE